MVSIDWAFLGPGPRAMLLVVLTAALARPGPVPARADEPPVTDATVAAAIERAVDWLKAQHQEDGQWEQYARPEDRYWGGDTALTVLALLYAGENPRSEFMASALDWLSAQELHGTYTYGTRAHALALVPGKKYGPRLRSDLDWLLANVWPADSAHPGAYDYAEPQGEQRGRWDNSNSQFGVLGAWMATEVGLSAPVAYWKTVGQHWTAHQQSDGGWSYQATGRSTGSMTAAGLASLFVVLDRAYGSSPQVAEPITAAIERGLDWFGREYTPENPHGERRWLYYYLYGVERAGRASGHKYFRGKDWFREGAGFLLSGQTAEGNWRGTGESMSPLRNTCFALMFLCHGRAPLMFNKLQHGPDWDARLRDVAGLTHYCERTLERLLNWQIVSLDGSMDDLLEAPVLYLRGESAWEFDEVQVQRLREYCRRGGLVLAVAGGDSEEFIESIRQLAERAFPEHPLEPLPADHPLFNGEVQFEIEEPPEILGVHNGVRTLLLLCSEDVGHAWHRQRGRRAHFELGCNIYNYATDKTSLRSRLETADIPLRKVDTTRRLKVALLKHAGNWNVEPYGWTRLKSYLNNELGIELLATSGLTFDSTALADFEIAYVTGTEAIALSPAEVAGLRDFIRRGGTLLFDAAGGGREFRTSLEALLTGTLKAEPVRLSQRSCILTGAGIPGAVDLRELRYTRAARGRSDRLPPVWAYRSGRRLAVVYSPLDLSAGLLGKHVYNLPGYEGDGALRIMRNLLLYADLPTREKVRLSP